MLIVALNHSVLCTTMSSSFSVPLSWLSLASSIDVYSKAMNVVTFQLTNDKKFKLTKKMFAQVLNIHTVEPYYEVTNEHVLHMFNEMGHQPAFDKNR